MTDKEHVDVEQLAALRGDCDSEEEAQQKGRQHERHSLREQGGDDLSLACDGVTVQLKHKGWFKERRLGVANIKDMGMGGLGLITATPLKLEQTLTLALEGKEMKVKVARMHKINSRLNFVGVRWLSTNEDAIAAMLFKIKTCLARG